MQTPERCCGSFVPTPSKQPLPKFQRFLPAITVFLTKGGIALGGDDERGYGRIGDLRVGQLDNTKVRKTYFKDSTIRPAAKIVSPRQRRSK
jgi:hypothetical protein